jgi:hypothetical protein
MIQSPKMYRTYIYILIGCKRWGRRFRGPVTRLQLLTYSNLIGHEYTQYREFEILYTQLTQKSTIKSLATILYTVPTRITTIFVPYPLSSRGHLLLVLPLLFFLFLLKVLLLSLSIKSFQFEISFQLFGLLTLQVSSSSAFWSFRMASSRVVRTLRRTSGRKWAPWTRTSVKRMKFSKIGRVLV